MTNEEMVKQIAELKKANETLKFNLDQYLVDINNSIEENMDLKKELNEAKVENVEANKIIINQNLRIDSLQSNVDRKSKLKVKSAEKINELIAENEELLNDNVEKTETLNNLRNSINEIQRENQVIHTALYEEQEKNVNFEITIKTLTKMVK